MMERRVPGNLHARCGAGEKVVIISKPYLSLYNLRNQKLRTESKLKSTIRRKKQALGLKENPLENLQLGE